MYVYVFVCVHTGLQDMLQMIAHQWQELQRQIRRQHGWMLRTLDTIKAQILTTKTDEDPKNTKDPDLYANAEVWSINPARLPNLTLIFYTTSLIGLFFSRLLSIPLHSSQLAYSYPLLTQQNKQTQGQTGQGRHISIGKGLKDRA